VILFIFLVKTTPMHVFEPNVFINALSNDTG